MTYTYMHIYMNVIYIYIYIYIDFWSFLDLSYASKMEGLETIWSHYATDKLLTTIVILTSKRLKRYLGAVHKVRHAIFGQFLPPPPVTLCHTSRAPSQKKYVTHLGPPPDF